MRNLGTKDGVLPPNPSWITFDTTDGDARRWPVKTTFVVDAEGYVNCMLPITEDHPSSIKWRVICGASIAEIMEYPDYETKKYVLKSWPDGYQMYDHNKGPATNPRHDLYLYGSDHVGRFRSPHELTPHLVWLLSDKTRDRRNCVCKYCAKRPQREVTQGLPVLPRSGTPSNGSKKKPRPVRASNHLRVQATVRRAPKPVRLPRGPSQFSAPDRERDLLAIVQSPNLDGKSPKQTRWARKGELVWVKLKEPIPTDEQSDPNKGIIFWPGLVQDYELRVKITPVDDDDMSVNGPSTNEGEEYCPWTITHSNVFHVRLLIASQDLRAEESELLPYQAYGPSADLIHLMQRVPVPIEGYPGLEDPRDADAQALERFSRFQPQPTIRDNSVDALRTRISEAAPAFALAVQIASRLTSYWTPVEAWDCRLVPQNAPVMKEEPRLSTPPIAGPSHPATPAIPVNTSNGPVQSSNGLIQTRFQGLWWGPEKIWVGDLVRLKLARYQFVPNGSEFIAKAASTTLLSPTQENGDVEMADADQLSEESLGSAAKGIFLRVDSIYSEPRESLGGKPAAMMSGMVYELVDEDWKEEPNNEEVAPPAPTAPTPLSGMSSTTLSNPPIFMPNPPLLTAGNETDSSDGSDDMNRSSDAPTAFIDKGKGKEKELVEPPMISPPRRATFRPPSNGAHLPPASTALSLSGPSPPYTYRLPSPPSRHKFRPIMPQTHEATMSVLLLAGRYYPGLLQSSTMQPIVSAAIEASENDHERILDANHLPLWALEGFVAGVHNSVDPSIWMSTRVGMVKAASETARKELLDYWRSREEKDPDVIIVD